MPAASSGGIFISYRRADTQHLAGRLHDRLAARFGASQIFMDVDAIELGADFVAVLTERVSACDVLLAVIGPQWLNITDGKGGRRLDDPDDLVRREVEVALDRGVRVIPILVEDAAMPRPQELPASLAALPHRNALLIRHQSFGRDVERLVKAIEGRQERRPGTVGVVPSPESTHVFSHHGLVEAVTFSPNGQWLATASADRRARIWDLTPRQRHILLEPKEPSGRVRCVAFSPDGRLLASCGDERTARIWDVVSEQVRVSLEHLDSVWRVAFSPRGNRLATSSGHRMVAIWDVPSWREGTQLVTDDYVWGLDFSWDGLLATAGADKTARIWDVASGKELARLTHDRRVWGVAFSPDGSLLASGSDDKTARIWDVASRREHAQFIHDQAVGSVAFSPDGRLLAAGSGDGSVRIWDITSNQEHARMSHDDLVWSVAFSPDGTLLASGSGDGTARIWAVRP